VTLAKYSPGGISGSLG